MTGGAQGGAHRDLLLALLRPAQQEVGHVGARDQQAEQRHGRQNHDQLLVRGAREEIPGSDDHDLTAAIGVRVGGLHGRPQTLELPLDTVERGTRGHTREADVASVAVVVPLIGEVRGAEGLDIGRNHVEGFGHDAYHRVGGAVHGEGTAEHVGVAEEAALPEVVSEDEHVAPSLGSLLGAEVPAQRGLRAQDIEEIGRRHHELELLGYVHTGEVRGLHGVDGGALQGARRRLVVPEVTHRGAAEVLDGLPLATLADQHEPVLVLVGKRLEEERVQDAEDAGVGGDAQREGQGSHGGDHRRLGQHAQPVPEILKQRRHPVPTSLASVPSIVDALPYGQARQAVSRPRRAFTRDDAKPSAAVRHPTEHGKATLPRAGRPFRRRGQEGTAASSTRRPPPPPLDPLARPPHSVHSHARDPEPRAPLTAAPSIRVSGRLHGQSDDQRKRSGAVGRG